MRRALALCLLGACGTSAPAPRCPATARTDPERAARVSTLLGSIDEGRTLVDGSLARVALICFDGGPLSVVTSEHVVLLDATLSDAEAAARLGHLLVHERDGHPMAAPVTPDTDCAAAVHDAIVGESVAYAAESRLRVALGVHDPRMAFEIDAETAPLPTAEAEARWLAYLEAHPDGAPGIDALAAGYLAQCERDRSR